MSSKSSGRLPRFLFAAIALLIVPAKGEFTRIDDFEELSPGNLDGQNSWTAGVEYSVVSDPGGGTNQVLQYTAGVQSGAFKGLAEDAVPEGASGTLFARFRFGSTANANFGFSDVAAPSVYNDFEAQINRQNGTFLKGRDGTGFQDFSPNVGGLDVWYKLWLVADNETDTSRGTRPVGRGSSLCDADRTPAAPTV